MARRDADPFDFDLWSSPAEPNLHDGASRGAVPRQRNQEGGGFAEGSMRDPGGWPTSAESTQQGAAGANNPFGAAGTNPGYVGGPTVPQPGTGVPTGRSTARRGAAPIRREASRAVTPVRAEIPRGAPPLVDGNPQGAEGRLDPRGGGGMKAKEFLKEVANIHKGTAEILTPEELTKANRNHAIGEFYQINQPGTMDSKLVNTAQDSRAKLAALAEQIQTLLADSRLPHAVDGFDIEAGLAGKAMDDFMKEATATMKREVGTTKWIKRKFETNADAYRVNYGIWQLGDFMAPRGDKIDIRWPAEDVYRAMFKDFLDREDTDYTPKSRHDVLRGILRRSLDYIVERRTEQESERLKEVLRELTANGGRDLRAISIRYDRINDAWTKAHRIVKDRYYKLHDPATLREEEEAEQRRRQREAMLGSEAVQRTGRKLTIPVPKFGTHDSLTQQEHKGIAERKGKKTWKGDSTDQPSAVQEALKYASSVINNKLTAETAFVVLSMMVETGGRVDKYIEDRRSRLRNIGGSWEESFTATWLFCQTWSDSPSDLYQIRRSMVRLVLRPPKFVNELGKWIADLRPLLGQYWMSAWVGTSGTDVDRYIKDDLHDHIKAVIQIWWEDYTPLIMRDYETWVINSSVGRPKSSDDVERAWTAVIQGLLNQTPRDDTPSFRVPGRITKEAEDMWLVLKRGKQPQEQPRGPARSGQSVQGQGRRSQGKPASIKDFRGSQAGKRTFQGNGGSPSEPIECWSCNGTHRQSDCADYRLGDYDLKKDRCEGCRGRHKSACVTSGVRNISALVEAHPSNALSPYAHDESLEANEETGKGSPEEDLSVAGGGFPQPQIEY